MGAQPHPHLTSSPRLRPWQPFQAWFHIQGLDTNSIGLAYDTEDANLFMLPVGVKYSSEIYNENGWTVRPIAEVGYVWAFGDTDTNQTVSLNGASNSFGYDIADGGSWVGLVGIQAVKDDWTFGVSYSYQDSDHSESKKWYVDAKYSF